MPAKVLHAPVPGTHGHTRMRQSLRGYLCPRDRTEFRLRADGVNECPACGFEAITEWEAERRQAARAAGESL